MGSKTNSTGANADDAEPFYAAERAEAAAIAIAGDPAHGGSLGWLPFDSCEASSYGEEGGDGSLTSVFCIEAYDEDAPCAYVRLDVSCPCGEQGAKVSARLVTRLWRRVDISGSTWEDVEADPLGARRWFMDNVRDLKQGARHVTEVKESREAREAMETASRE